MTTICRKQFAFDANVIRRGSLQLPPLLVVEGASNILLNHLILHNLFDLIRGISLNYMCLRHLLLHILHHTGHKLLPYAIDL